VDARRLWPMPMFTVIFTLLYAVGDGDTDLPTWYNILWLAGFLGTAGTIRGFLIHCFLGVIDDTSGNVGCGL